jgi:hypothetical protein
MKEYSFCHKYTCQVLKKYSSSSKILKYSEELFRILQVTVYPLMISMLILRSDIIDKNDVCLQELYAICNAHVPI